MEAHKRLQTWILVPINTIPQGNRVLQCKFFGKVKRNADGTINKFKMRLVARGDMAKEHVHFGSSSAPVPSNVIFRALVALAAANGWDITQWDVSTAFLEADIDNDNCYIRMPQHYRRWVYQDGLVRNQPKHRSEHGVELVGHLRRALYGMPQGMRLYIKLFHDFLLEQGFKQSKVDLCLWHKFTTATAPDGTITEHCIHLMHHVDDKLIATTPNNPAYDDFITNFQQRFTVTGGNQASYFLNMEILHTPESIQISQRAHIRQIVEACLGGNKTSTETMPLPKDYEPTKLDSPTDEEKAALKPMAEKYRKLLGMCLWVSTQTRLDVSASVATLGRFASNPSKRDYRALKHLARYLSCTSDLSIELLRQPEKKNEIAAYVDADFGSDRDTSKSTSGQVVMLHGGPIAYSAKRQPIIAMSTMEAELIALTAGSLTTVYCRWVMESFGLGPTAPTTVYEDNKSAIYVAENDMIGAKARAIPRRYFKVRELIRGTGDKTDPEYQPPHVSVVYIASKLNLADLLTKQCDQATHDTHVAALLKKRLL